MVKEDRKGSNSLVKDGQTGPLRLRWRDEYVEGRFWELNLHVQRPWGCVDLVIWVAREQMSQILVLVRMEQENQE